MHFAEDKKRREMTNLFNSSQCPRRLWNLVTMYPVAIHQELETTIKISFITMKFRLVDMVQSSMWNRRKIALQVARSGYGYSEAVGQYDSDKNSCCPGVNSEDKCTGAEV